MRGLRRLHDGVEPQPRRRVRRHRPDPARLQPGRDRSTRAPSTTKRACASAAAAATSNGVKVGLVAATYGTNGFPLPADEPWSVPIIDVGHDRGDGAPGPRRGRRHRPGRSALGDEYVHTPTAYQIDVASRSPRQGHHPHLRRARPRRPAVHEGQRHLGRLRPRQHGRPQATDVEGVYDGLTVRVTFTEVPDGTSRSRSSQYIPTMITHFDGVHPMRWLDVPRDLDEPLRGAASGSGHPARVADVNSRRAEHGVTDLRVARTGTLAR